MTALSTPGLRPFACRPLQTGSLPGPELPPKTFPSEGFAVSFKPMPLVPLAACLFAMAGLSGPLGPQPNPAMNPAPAAGAPSDPPLPVDPSWLVETTVGIESGEAAPGAGPADDAPASLASFAMIELESAPTALPLPPLRPEPPDGAAPDAVIADSADDTRRVLQVEPGDTLMGLLTGQGVVAGEAHEAIDALREAFDPRRLRAGQEITVTLDPAAPEPALAGLELMPSVDSVVSVTRAPDGGFLAHRTDAALETRPVAAAGTIESSLYAAAGAAGVPDQVTLGVIRIWAHAVDFQRDLHPGDRFSVLYERDHLPDGEVARNGEVLYAALRLGDRDLEMHRFETPDGRVDYYDRDGRSIRRALLRTPIDGARLSSGYGMRRHPILGYSRMHRGVDFAAPSGTPVFAAGDGVIETIGTNAGYGLYVRLRHTGRIDTAYAHLSRFASGMTRGRRVEQGEVIGYVGSTGLSTGPHLHYEVLADGAQVDPLSRDERIGRTLEGAELAAFRRMLSERQRLFAALPDHEDMVAEAAP